MEDSEEPKSVWEDSPTTLVERHKTYNGLIARYRGDGNPKFCRISLITDNLAIAASEPICCGQILRKIV